MGLGAASTFAPFAPLSGSASVKDLADVPVASVASVASGLWGDVENAVRSGVKRALEYTSGNKASGSRSSRRSGPVVVPAGVGVAAAPAVQALLSVPAGVGVAAAPTEPAGHGGLGVARGKDVGTGKEQGGKGKGKGKG